MQPTPSLRNCSTRWMPTGAPQTTSRSARLSLRQSAAEAAADAGGCEAHAARPLGHYPRAELHLRASDRVIKKYDLDMIYVSGPGHGGPGRRGQHLPRGHLQRIYPDISQDEAGLRKLFLQFSFPGGIPSHASPETPGSIHEGGELGYSLSHSFGAVFDNPDLVVACVVGDGEAETGPLATGLAFEQVPRSDYGRRGAADPAPQWLQDFQSDRPRPQSAAWNWNNYSAATDGCPTLSSARTTNRCMKPWPRRSIRGDGDQTNPARRPRLRQPDAAALADDRPQFTQGLDRAKWVDGLQIEGTFRAHQVPLSDPAAHPNT